jgi:glutamate racemase
MILAAAPATRTNAAADDQAHLVDYFFAKKEVTICVADVGLGGLSVLSEIERQLDADPTALGFARVKLLYYNAAVRPGYTKRPIKDQTTIFDAALAGMRLHKPDMILIACNTLSVLYADTEYAAGEPSIPVLSIVGFGVERLTEALRSDPTAVAMIFGTSTTARVAAHRDGLVAHGVAPARVVMKGCPRLATDIQSNGADSAEATSLLGKFVAEAWAEMDEGVEGGMVQPPSAVFAGLCCTHYGYSSSWWEKAMAAEAEQRCLANTAPLTTSTINPNSDMAAYIFEQAKVRRSAVSVGDRSATACAVDIQVLSLVPLASEIESIAPLLSVPVGAALRRYNHDANLFDHPIIHGNRGTL